MTKKPSLVFVSIRDNNYSSQATTNSFPLILAAADIYLLVVVIFCLIGHNKELFVFSLCLCVLIFRNGDRRGTTAAFYNVFICRRTVV